MDLSFWGHFSDPLLHREKYLLIDYLMALSQTAQCDVVGSHKRTPLFLGGRCHGKNGSFRTRGS